MTTNVFRIQPFQYIHVLDNNSNITRMIPGPKTFIRKEHEVVVDGPTNMLKLPPRHYCYITNPVERDSKGALVLTTFGQVANRFGDFEIRTSEKYPDPFPLYPGEALRGGIEEYLIVPKNQSLVLKASRDFKDDKGVTRSTGDEWQIDGPFTYHPRIEAEVVRLRNAQVIKANQALRLQAIKNTVDANGVSRIKGEEWLIREEGSYLTRIDEEVFGIITGSIINDKKALKLEAKKNFTDVYGFERKAGQQWLITSDISECHIPDIHENVIGEVDAIILSSRQYCVILDAYDPKTRINKWGSRVLKRGEAVFFLQPGETLEDDQIKSVEILAEDEALLLQATEDFTEGENKYTAGQKWLKVGPCEFIPSVQVRIVERRKKIPLDRNEGIYVRNLDTGNVRMVIGQTYLLQAHEQLWQKELPTIVEELLAAEKEGKPYVPKELGATQKTTSTTASTYKRDKTRVVTYRAPSNSAVQLFDFKTKKSRVEFGPTLVMLGPDEQFSIQSLSAGVPKTEDANKQIALRLGPGYMFDIVQVETSDHARLTLKVSYGWMFRFDRTKAEEADKIFSVKDFVGNISKSVASRVRGAVSGVNFDEFHKRRKEIIEVAVFGHGNELFFPTNNLVVMNVDVHNPEPVDPKMRENLFRAQTMNIEITTKMQEMNARHHANKLDQESKGELEIQRYKDQSHAEEANKNLLELQAETEAIKVKGKALAVAKAKAEAEIIDIEAEVIQASLKAKALRLETDTEVDTKKNEYDADLAYIKRRNDLEVLKAKEFADIEIDKFEKIMNSIGKEAIVAMAKAGPETQAKLLKGLGLKGMLISDGKNPINLFNPTNLLGDE